jgi:outer membrane protein assembly factor BamE (lipoprotein component of BamABCDE complex)
LRAGYGTLELHVGQAPEQVRDLLGQPDEQRGFTEQYFWIYQRLGIDIDFGATRNRVQRLFFYKGGVENHHTAKVRIDGIIPGSSRQKVINSLGAPERSGRVGEKEWLWYSRGVQFDVSDNHVIVIIVFERNPI